MSLAWVAVKGDWTQSWRTGLLMAVSWDGCVLPDPDPDPGESQLQGSNWCLFLLLMGFPDATSGPLWMLDQDAGPVGPDPAGLSLCSYV